MDVDALPLRDIHLPEAIGWWPPAPGWWLLGVVLALMLWWVAGKLRQFRHRRRDPARIIPAHFAMLRQCIERDPDAIRAAIKLSEFVRRFALTLRPREEVAAIAGDAWLSYLDKDLGGDEFRNGPGRILVDLPYRSGTVSDDGNAINACLDLVEAWVTRVISESRKAVR